MSYEGTDLKFRMTSTIDGFSFDDHKFMVVIKNRWGRVVETVIKDLCFKDSEGQWYFTFENPPIGTYIATFVAYLPDDDYDKQMRVITDIQPIASVGVSCNMKDASCQCDHKVHYEQVWATNIDDGSYLCDKDGNLILTADGKRIQFISTPKTEE